MPSRAHLIRLLPHAWFIAILIALWAHWVSPDITIPLSPTSDGLYFWGLIKTIFANGTWLQANDLGAPFGANTYDFPYSDTLLFLIIKLLHLFTNDAGVAWNLFYLVTFLLAYLTAFVVLRRRLDHVIIASLGAFIFAVLPYHFQRAPHLLLAAYFMVPLVIDLALDLAETDGHDTTRIGAWIASHKRAIAVAIAGAACGVYYAFFSCIAYSFCGLASSIRARNGVALQRSVVVVAIASMTVLANVAPTLRFWSQHGFNTGVAARSADESERYGLSLAMLLLPTDDHRGEKINDWGSKARKQYMFDNEASNTSLGLLPSIGFLTLLFASLGLVSASQAQRRLRSAADLNLVLVLYAVIGGFGFLFAAYVSPQLRALNRASVFIGFLSVYALAIVVRNSRFIIPSHDKAKPWAAGALVAATTLLVLFDQIPRQFPERWPRVHSDLGVVKHFVQKIESTLSPGSPILMLPYVPYPEGGAFDNEGSYSMLRPYVYSHVARWSYGAMKGRPEDLWLRSLSLLPIADQAKIARIVGFRGVYIQRKRYPDHGAQVENALASLAGQPMTSDDANLAYYDLDRLPKEDAAAVVPPLYGDGFYTAERNGLVEWRWARGNTYLSVFNQSQVASVQRLSFELMTVSSRNVAIALEGPPPTPLRLAQLTPGIATHVTVDVRLAPGWNRISLRTDKPAVSPGPKDSRMLAFGVKNFAYAAVQ